MMHKAVFIDKDGTLIPDIPFNADPQKIRLNDFAGEALARVSKSGFHLFVVTNQPGIMLGYFTEKQLMEVKERIGDLLAAYHIRLSGFCFCPHDEKANCHCRKPRPGLLLDAARAYHIDLKNSWMIGDILNDVEAGNRAGCHTILLNNGNETVWLDGKFRKPDFTVANLWEASECILTVTCNDKKKAYE